MDPLAGDDQYENDKDNDKQNDDNMILLALLWS